MRVCHNDTIIFLLHTPWVGVNWKIMFMFYYFTYVVMYILALTMHGHKLHILIHLGAHSLVPKYLECMSNIDYKFA